MAAYRRIYDSHHLQADCQEPGSAPEPHGPQSSMGYLFKLCSRSSVVVWKSGSLKTVVQGVWPKSFRRRA